MKMPTMGKFLALAAVVACNLYAAPTIGEMIFMGLGGNAYLAVNSINGDITASDNLLAVKPWVLLLPFRAKQVLPSAETTAQR